MNNKAQQCYLCDLVLLSDEFAEDLMNFKMLAFQAFMKDMQVREVVKALSLKVSKARLDEPLI